MAQQAPHVTFILENGLCDLPQVTTEDGRASENDSPGVNGSCCRVVLAGFPCVCRNCVRKSMESLINELSVLGLKLNSRSPRQVLYMIKTLNKNHGALYFSFVSLAMSVS